MASRAGRLTRHFECLVVVVEADMVGEAESEISFVRSGRALYGIVVPSSSSNKMYRGSIP